MERIERAEGERRASRSIVTSVALSGFVGVAHSLRLRTTVGGRTGRTVEARPIRATARGRPLAIIFRQRRTLLQPFEVWLFQRSRWVTRKYMTKPAWFELFCVVGFGINRAPDSVIRSWIILDTADLGAPPPLRPPFARRQSLSFLATTI